MSNPNYSRTLAAQHFAAVVLLASAGSALAEARYVDVNSTNATPPYISWFTAATNIQDAVDAAVAGDEIVVTNGIYASGGRNYSRVAVDKPLSLRSVNGPQFTAIVGPGRCVYLTDGASLSGFTLTNGWVLGDGAGVFCESQSAVVTNCVVSGNSAHSFGGFGGFGGGVSRGTLNNCTLTGNSAHYIGPNVTGGRGGGAFGSVLNNCALTRNSAYELSGWEGSAGGGASDSTLNNCTLTSNFAVYGGGAFGSILNNCTLTGNSGFEGGGAYGGNLNNCTLTGNYADSSGGGASKSTLNNCIVYFNTAPQEPNYDSYSTLNYTCTTPLPTNGVGNITKEPAFVNPVGGNYRLRPDSPCIDAGTNLSTIITNDLDGRPRPLDGDGDGLAAFDMGAYEYRTPLLVWQDSPNPSWPHADWATAAHTIQDAVDAAVAGDEIVVTNGFYATGGRATVADGTTNRVAVDKPVTVRSVNGSQSTTIDGGHSARCVYLTNGASLSGFTLTNGFAFSGGGLACESTNAIVSNCVVAGNLASYAGRGGGAIGGTLNNCTLSGNSGYRLQNPGNLSIQSFGGGASGSTLNNCTLSGNSASVGGGASQCVLNNCTLTGNRALGGYDIINFPGSGGGAYFCTLNNCIRTGNSDQGNGAANYDSCTLNYSCTMPDPGGVGNITNAPLFDLASGNLRLQSNSPCINAGLNAFAPAGPDLDGNARIAGGTVDMGAYELQSPASMISHAWLHQFNLPINPSTDTADPDGDGVNNYREWLAGSDPTNPFSFPPLLTLIPYGANVILTWPTNAVGFTLQSTTNLGLPAVWSANSPAPVNIGGQNVIINPLSGPQQFYRLKWP